jgi:hypothetical protein
MSTNTQPTVSDVLQIVSDLRGESSTNTDAIRIRAVSRANQDFARRMLWRFYRLDNQTMVGTAVNSYTIGSATNPMRMKGLTEVFVSDTTDTDKTQESQRYSIVDYNTYKNLYNLNNNEQMVYEWFDVANDVWKMYINPAPAATKTITYSFYWEPPAKTLTTDKVICPNPIILADLAIAQIYESEDERELALEKRNEAEQLIAEIIGKENSPAINQRYSMGAVENATSNHGIGSY